MLNKKEKIKRFKNGNCPCCNSNDITYIEHYTSDMYCVEYICNNCLKQFTALYELKLNDIIIEAK